MDKPHSIPTLEKIYSYMLVQVLPIALSWMNYEDDFKKTISPILEATIVAILLYDYDGMSLYMITFNIYCNI